MVKYLKLALIFVLLIQLFMVTSCTNSPEFQLTVNGKSVKSSVDVFFYDENDTDTAMFPYKELLEALEVPAQGIKYHEKSHSLEIRLGETYIFLTEENKYPLVNTQLSEITAPPVIKEGQFCIPIKFVAEALGYKFNWNETEKIIEIAS